MAGKAQKNPHLSAYMEGADSHEHETKKAAWGLEGGGKSEEEHGMGKRAGNVEGCSFK